MNISNPIIILRFDFENGASVPNLLYHAFIY